MISGPDTGGFVLGDLLTVLVVIFLLRKSKKESK